MIYKWLINIKHNSTFKESLTLIISEGIGLLFSMLIYLFRPRFLTVDEIGMISYIVSIVSFCSTFFTFGIDNSGARIILKQTSDKAKKDMAGFILMVGLGLCAVFSVFLFAASYIMPFIGREDVLPLLHIIAVFAGYNIILTIYTQICYASGKIKQAAVQLMTYYIAYFFCMISLYYFGVYTLKVALLTEFSLHMIVVIVPIVLIYRREIRYSGDYLKQLITEQRDRGWTIYLSRIIFMPAFNLDTIILGIFHPLSSVAFYSLAVIVASPINVVGNSIARSLYRKFYGKSVIGWRKEFTIITITAVVAFADYFASILAIEWILGKEYEPMLTILPLAIVASSIRGITAMYTEYMNSNGLAKQLRIVSIVGLISSLALNFGLIIPFGATGGVYASIIILTINLLLRIYFCRRSSIVTKAV